MVQCHLPKPVLLPTGEVFWPWQWHPNIVDTQMIRIGNLFISALPGEFTTMAGRRLKKSLSDVLTGIGLPSNASIVITGLSNTYTHYITTPEEYAIQRYEGASTIYGPNTMAAYIQQYNMLAEKLVNSETIEPGPAPPNLLREQRGFLLPTRVELFSPLALPGSTYIDVDPKYRQGSVVKAVFWAGNPRNDVTAMLEGTFLQVLQCETVLRCQVVVYSDWDWCTRFYWETDETGAVLKQKVTIYWDIPLDQELGNYRLKHIGYTKGTDGVEAYEGRSSQFEVVPLQYSRP